MEPKEEREIQESELNQNVVQSGTGNVGEEVVVTDAPVKEEHEVNEVTKENKKGKKIKGKTVVIILGFILVLIIVALFIVLISQYNAGNEAFDNKNYLEAISKYEKISWYSDTEDRLTNAYIEYGMDRLNNDDCQTALSYFDKANLDENDEYVKYCNMFIKYYDDFKKAEENFNAGKLSKAKEIYSKIDSSFKYHDIKVADRLNTLKEYEKFVNLTGTKSGTGKMEVRHIYKRDNSQESWYADYTNSCDVTSQIQEDGSVKIFVTARFYSYSKYSSLSYALGEKEYTAYYSVTVKKDGSIPNKFGSFPAAVAPSGTKGNATLTYSDGKFTLDFLLDDKNYSQYFRNKYTSKITYKQLKYFLCRVIC